MPSAQAEADADTNSGAEAEAEAGVVNNSNSNVVTNANSNVVTPPPCPIPPGLMPSEERTETALSWLRRSEAALARAAAPPPKPEDYLRGEEWRDVAVEEYWGGGAGTGFGGSGVGGPTLRALNDNQAWRTLPETETPPHNYI